MHTYIHRVNYYETDKMGITHHSNYVRWMEEARMDFLKSVGYGMRRLEADGITSPVVSLECRYKLPTTFDDEIKIEVSLEKYTGAKLELGYTMTNIETGKVVLTASSSHCFITPDGKPIAVKKHFPEFDEVLRGAASKEKVVEKAYNLAKEAHKGQVDKGGHDYINHPIAVADLVTTGEEKVVALLHDTVEDTDITLQSLREHGFSKRIVDAVDCLTKRTNETRESYLSRVKSNPLAATVKIADLTHNSDISRISQPKEKDFARVEGYKKEILFLQNSDE